VTHAHRRLAPGRARHTSTPVPGGAAKLPGDNAKRALDVTAALAAIAVLSPLLALLWLLVRRSSPGPALFRQERLGRGCQPFTMLKFRSMRTGGSDTIHREYVTALMAGDKAAASAPGGLFKLAGDPRVTPLGGWLRRTSLDELPQLFNVLHGEMSLVGPRPVLAWEADMFSEQQRQRFGVKPGLTGLWQVSGRNRLTMSEALDLDVAYVQRRSFALDLSILARTVPALLRGGAR
jgi:lipopolysaccharide/colanic/teichoic acid biosynthesis glycosyltransferase